MERILNHEETPAQFEQMKADLKKEMEANLGQLP